MSENPEQEVQVDDAAQAPVGGNDATAAHERDLLKANNQKLLAELKNARTSSDDMQRRLAELEQQDQSRKQADLLANGQAEELVNQLRTTVGDKDQRILDLEQQLQAKDLAFQESQIRATAINAFTQGGVHSPEDLFHLEKDKLRMKDGSVVALVGGVETPLQQHLDTLKSPGSGRDYFFAGSGARGMSAVGSQANNTGGKDLNSMSFSERLQLEVEQPELYARLKAAAG